MKKFKVVGIIVIVAGLLLEIFMIGSAIRLGTLIAGIGIFVYVYAVFQKPRDRDL